MKIKPYIVGFHQPVDEGAYDIGRYKAAAAYDDADCDVKSQLPLVQKVPEQVALCEAEDFKQARLVLEPEVLDDGGDFLGRGVS